MQHIQQSVQRLGMSLSNSLPSVLSSLNYAPTILDAREALIKNGLTKGNNRHVNAYKKLLPDTLPPEVFDWCVGLLLSDATLQKNISAKNPAARIKIQQSMAHRELIEVTQELLKPWIFSIGDKSQTMLEIATIQHKAFLPLIDVFHDYQTPIKASACVYKKPQPSIKDHLTPICVAAWYMGDGNLAGRACNFHTEGFLKEGTELLAQLLTEIYGWETRVIDAGYSDYLGHSMHMLQVRSYSSDEVAKVLTPFMLDSFKYKIPLPRIRKKRAPLCG
uniref:Homing endonuclease LAGLIDADG domain-containing protein n=1 Tax=Pediastrum duplex TaxID=3105 RepID=A0A1W6F7N5_PEDDU|nr:hypothetical protein [Pediastrum duplex]YP_009364104.1 hypothetical protein [Pediastrum duplex]ARK36699.1 hypothetical protein [Pediastrum duplex]ARK36702.1 hypothetical protein [Pediastrum duplex]